MPGGAGSNHGPKGHVQINESGTLEYWKEDEEEWGKSSDKIWWRAVLIKPVVPAVWHCEIRDKLINMAKTCQADVYSSYAMPELW